MMVFKVDGPVKIRKPADSGIPAFAGMTALGIFYWSIKFVNRKGIRSAILTINYPLNQGHGCLL